MKNTNEIKCPFCGGEMCIESWANTKPCQAWTKCNRCEACGPHAYHDQEGRSKELAIKAIRDYENRIDADLWRASKGVR